MSSVMSVPPSAASKRWSWANARNAPAVITSRKYAGRSNAVTCEVSRWRTSRCRASQVTDSHSPISPVVHPATARSPVSASERTWKPMSRARSKQTVTGAAIVVTMRNAAIALP